MTMLSALRSPFIALKRYPMPVTAVVLAVACYVAASMVTERIVRREAFQRFISCATVVRSSLAMRTKSYTDLLRAGASLFRTSPDITPLQFRSYFEGMDMRRQFPGAYNLNYAEFVRGDQTDAIKAKLTGYARATPWMRLPESVIYPAGRRDYYLILTMIEPPADSYGVDLLMRGKGDPNTRRMLFTRDSGQQYSSGEPIKEVSSPHNPMIPIRMAVYRHDLPVETADQRRDAFQGSLGIAISINELLQSALAESTVPGVRIRVSDMGDEYDLVPERAGARAIYDSAGTDRQPFPLPGLSADEMFRTSVTVPFANRRWQLSLSAEAAGIFTMFDKVIPVVAGAMAAAGSLLLCLLISSQVKSRRRAQAHHDLRLLADNAERVKELERKRIAREIHDDLGQNLMVLRMDADIMLSKTQARMPRLCARARATLTQVDSAIGSLRRIINDLRPEVLDHGLAPALSWQVKEFERHSGVACTLRNLLPSDCEEIEQHATTCFRILQESLANITKHAQASEVKVAIGLAGDHLLMTISDNGKGLGEAADKEGAFGLIGIRERAAMRGGHAVIDSPAAGGTMVSVYLPLQERLESAAANRQRWAEIA